MRRLYEQDADRIMQAINLLLDGTTPIEQAEILRRYGLKHDFVVVPGHFIRDAEHLRVLAQQITRESERNADAFARARNVPFHIFPHAEPENSMPYRLK